MSFLSPPPFPGQGGPGGAGPSRTNAKAVASLVLGIVSIVTLLGVLAGIPAILLGRAARREIRGQGGAQGADRGAAPGGALGAAQGGEWMATAGVVLGWLSIPVSVTVFTLLFAGGAFGH